MENNIQKVKDIVKIKAGFAFKGEDFSDVGTSVIKIKNISQNGEVDVINTEKINLEKYPNLPEYLILRENDWVIAMTGAEIGKVGKIRNVGDQKFLLNQRVARICSDSDFKKDYIGYLLSTPAYQKLIRDTAHGSAQANISSSSLEDIEIPNIGTNEQKRISSILSSFDNKIEQLKKENNILEDIAQNIFKEWFIKYNFPNKDGKPYKDNKGKMIDSELGLIPEGWKAGKLGDIVSFIKGIKPIIFTKTGQLYLTLDVMNQQAKAYTQDKRCVPVSKDDFMMVMDGASSGELFRGYEGFLASTLSKIECTDSSREYVYQVIKYNGDYIKKNLTGSAIPHTDRKLVESIPICYNPEVSQLFDRIVGQLYTKIFCNKLILKEMSFSHKTLLNKLIK